MSFCQTKNFKNELLGIWEAYNKTTLDGEDGSDLTLDGEPFTIELKLIFHDDERATFENPAGKVKTTYSVKGDTLKVSYFTYSIVEVSKSQLVIKEEKLMGGLIYLKKIGD
ncbi:hypothetical protein FVB32_16380 [Flagellimonas hymeniacidonis]|uniref:Lipocalin-like domain-containing protein n=1 Tax=Flagellimonas hymeniacidonis TaxID=2603628 RepID=A0A5C8V3J6_9FLAO|nr:hypothetical protein [Flagellimonas hymeniacidonis]TXN36134.1 hypothetical protein FVB32_16380 [Flagellimonas hymeniacidonis]